MVDPLLVFFSLSLCFSLFVRTAAYFYFVENSFAFFFKFSFCLFYACCRCYFRCDLKFLFSFFAAFSFTTNFPHFFTLNFDLFTFLLLFHIRVQNFGPNNFALFLCDFFLVITHNTFGEAKEALIIFNIFFRSLFTHINFPPFVVFPQALIAAEFSTHVRTNEMLMTEWRISSVNSEEATKRWHPLFVWLFVLWVDISIVFRVFRSLMVVTDRVRFIRCCDVRKCQNCSTYRILMEKRKWKTYVKWRTRCNV